MMTQEAPFVEINNLVVEYGKGKKVHRAVDGISFKVKRGECVGFIGANGAGKSTTIKTLMGFMFPTSGDVQIFGQSPGSVESRRNIGYLPEVALYYPFMKARELLNLYGGLQGMSKKDLREKIPQVLAKVGLGGKSESLLKSFSKGMQQRLGIAQALIAEPEALILDELSSGLDPLGRYDLRQVMLELKEQGRTIFFSSHELSEVEDLCDRVIMIHQGKIVAEASVVDLMKPLNQYEIHFENDDEIELPEWLQSQNIQNKDKDYMVQIDDIEHYTKALNDLRLAGFKINETTSRNQSLEQYFISLISEEEPSEEC